MKTQLILLVGSYTQPEAHVPSACGEGIVTFGFDSDTGKLTKLSVFPDILNPSYIAADIANKRVFAVSENISAEGSVCQFDCDENGKLTPVSRQNSHGLATCHVAVLPNGVCAASYFGGGLTVYPIENKKLGAASRFFVYQGKGANPQRQEASHAHQAVVSPDGQWFYVCDLGADCLWKHEIAAENEPIALPMPAGFGPRHMVFHSTLPRAWVLGELMGAVAVCDWKPNGSIEVLSLTPDIEENASAAAIRVHPSGKTLWISARKHPALRVFPLDENGIPGEPAEISLTAGEPRDFTISPDGRWLVVATQNANSLIVIALDSFTGQPTGEPHQHYPVGTPVSVLFL